MAPQASRRAAGKKSGGEDRALGEWIRSTRMVQGMSQRALAGRAGISRSYLCDIERGRGTQPSVTVLDKLAVALGASRWDLLRAAGILEPTQPAIDDGSERRLLALYRDLSDGGRASIERFARFIHNEEHQWVQPLLVHDEIEAPLRNSIQSGPSLFDTLPRETSSSSKH